MSDTGKGTCVTENTALQNEICRFRVCKKELNRITQICLGRVLIGNNLQSIVYSIKEPCRSLSLTPQGVSVNCKAAVLSLQSFSDNRG